MNRDAAFTRLERYAQIESDPVLDEDDLEAFLDEHAVAVDVDGNEPSSDDWTPTYSVIGVYRAAAAAWELKAAKATSRFDFTTDGQQFRRSQVVDHCHRQADMYRRKASGTTLTGG